MIHLPIGEIIMALWLPWGGYWWIASRGVQREAPRGSARMARRVEAELRALGFDEAAQPRT